MSDKIYCGNGKEKRFDNGDSIVNLLVDVDALSGAFKEYGFTTTGGKRKIRINVCKSKQIDAYNNTHYAVVDTWKPEPKPKSFEDDAPF